MVRGILRVVLITLVAVFLIGGAYIGGFGVSRLIFAPTALPDGGAPAEWQANFPVFWEAWNYVHQDFYKAEIDDSALVNGAVSGMVDSLGDPHTLFIDAKRAAISQSQMQGSFEGIGATVEMREGRLTIVAPIKDSPAEKAGLRPDDVVLQVDDKIIQNMDINEAVSLIRGPKGTTVRLKIQRARQVPFDVSIVRDTIKTTSVEARLIEGTNLGYVELSQFSATVPEDLDDALQALMAQNVKGLILDLRGNPGGFLSVTIDVASQFLSPGQQVVVIKDKNGNENPCPDDIGRPVKCTTKPGGRATSMPIVVLIDKGSASASEIVAAALQDHGRAKLVGVKTFGKGSVQNDHSLSDGSELNVTIAHFFSPKGHEINDVGVAPDVQVELTEDDIVNRRDLQLDKAIELLKAQVGTTSLLVR
ncbi:MAG: S41 family peptidase [Chloroflexi bacterium]|nr:S41 family peptidase [Chloroflexota bacterium]